MDLLETKDQLIIVNRSKDHKISKQLIRKVPYFEKMLSLDLKESKESKVVLDFDSKALQSFLDWLILGNIFIEMDYVINLCNMIDYFGIKDHLVQDFNNYFNDNFSIEHLPVVIPQVTPVSKLMNSSHLNAFICRYFTKIIDTTIWLDYPIETIDYMCSLDLMIHSEYQVFDAIMKWIKAKVASRKCYIERLLKLVRWCHSEDKDLPKMKEQVRSLNCQPSKLSSFRKRDCDLTCNRTKQEYFIEIYHLNATSLRIIISDSNFYPLIEQVIKLNNSMTIDVLHVEHVSDVFFDSGKEGIRIDWKRNEYRLLAAYEYKALCVKIHNCIQEKNMYGALLFEAREKFLLIRNNYLLVCLPANAELIFKNFQGEGRYFRATILGDNIYIVDHYADFIKFNIYTNEKTVIGCEKFKNRLTFDNLLITSRKANDDRVFFIDKSSKDAFCFNVNTQQWSSMGRIINRKFSIVQDSTNKLLTLNSTFISLDTMRTYLTHNDNSKN
uniref:BTB domain-containing protein n=1 Tax=Tetranychus urticae TaxID=32264 RepID=T1JY99_TETUR